MPAATFPALRWDIFCRVVDNFGDIGMCWRLARALAQRGQQVRLFVDDGSALAWMAPDGAPGVVVLPWPGDTASAAEPGEVVVEAFGCDPPPAFAAAMAARAGAGRPPVWINLEYLSAEAYVERSHGLASPQWSGPGAGLSKWFFYPGFSPATGGLLQGAGTALAPGHRPDATALQQLGLTPGAGERSVSLFCYDSTELPPLLQRLAAMGPLQLLAAPGPALQALTRTPLPAGLRLRPLPPLRQVDYDLLLAGCELNIVRGEDSFVRAQLCSPAPMLWMVYPQPDGAHGPKLDAFLAYYLAEAGQELASKVRALFLAFNGLAPWPTTGPGEQLLADWARAHQQWRAKCLQQPPLDQRLLSFVMLKR